MRPKVVICGRPNVGKSTLFNLLTSGSRALVHDRPGVTRDWVSGSMRGGAGIEVIDTAGIDADKSEDPVAAAKELSYEKAVESQLVLLVVDGRQGLTPDDQDIALHLRKNVPTNKVWLLVNKTESMQSSAAMSEFHKLGFDSMYTIATAHGIGIAELNDRIAEVLHDGDNPVEHTGRKDRLEIAIIGRPNVGKSTLTNKLLGEERMIVADMPGTTVDSVRSEFTFRGQQMSLVDSAGVRRKSKIDSDLEKFSARYARHAAEQADIVILMIDISEGVVHQDQLLASLIHDYGRTTVVVLNKADLLEPYQLRKVRAKARRELPFMEHAELVVASVSSDEFEVDTLLDTALASHAKACQQVSSNKLSKVLHSAVEKNEPPRNRGKRPSLRYAHQEGTNPPLIVIHGRHVSLLKTPYIRYLVNQFNEQLGYAGSPLHIRFKESPANQARVK